MEPENESFQSIRRRLQSGDTQAQREVFERFRDQLLALARKHLHQRVQRLVEPDDVVNSALKSFFVREAQGQFELESWNSLWKLVMQIAIRKCQRKNAHYRAARRDLGQETPSDQLAGELSARQPTADEIVETIDTVEHLMRQLSNDRSRSIVSHRFSGHTETEIAETVGCSVRTVRRVLATSRELLAAMLQDH